MKQALTLRREAKDRSRFSLRHDFDADIAEDFDDAHRLFDDLRSRCPVAHSNNFGGFWLLMRYQDIADAMANSALSSTAVQNVVPRVATSGRKPPMHLDPPEHTPYRRALAPLFRREREDYLQPIVTGFAEALFAPLAEREGADIYVDSSYHLQIRVLGELFQI